MSTRTLISPFFSEHRLLRRWSCIDLQDLVAPHRADLLFLHEVDHLVQLEAIWGLTVYSYDAQLREEYEERVMKFAADELQIFKRNENDFFGAVKDGYFEFEYKAA